jgi:hypothetical protein
MSKAPNKAADFLKAMQAGSEPPEPPRAANEAGQGPAEVVAVPASAPAKSTPKPRPRKVAKQRSALKHFGGYLDDDTLEKIALLRVRLKKDNSDLMKLAIDELYAKHKAKRAFGDS